MKISNANHPHAGIHPTRAGFATPVASGAMRSGYSHQGVPATPQFATPQAPTPATIAPGGYGTMGPNHQQLMMDRQQAQMTAQSQARLAAQGTMHRHGSGTPQPPTSQYNGQHGQHGQQPPPNGAPVVA